MTPNPSFYVLHQQQAFGPFWDQATSLFSIVWKDARFADRPPEEWSSVFAALSPPEGIYLSEQTMLTAAREGGLMPIGRFRPGLPNRLINR